MLELGIGLFLDELLDNIVAKVWEHYEDEEQNLAHPLNERGVGISH
jgi:hypothetical protein